MLKTTTLILTFFVLHPAFIHASELEQALSDYEYGRFEEALQTLERLANDNNIEAQYHLAFMYFNGDGVENDDSVAASWFERAAMSGHAGAQDILAYMYLNGRGVGPDPVQAYAWYSLAAENGIFLANKIIAMLDRELSMEDRLAARLMVQEYRQEME